MKKFAILLAISISMFLISCGSQKNGLQTNELQTQESQNRTVSDSTAAESEVTDLDEREEQTDTEEGTLNLENSEDQTSADAEEDQTMKMTVTVGGKDFSVTLEDNEAVEELVRMMQQEPVSISMSDYSGFEKVGSLGRSLPTSNKQMTTRSGDIVLYNGNQIVIFYGSNSWSYTKLGHVDDLTGWEDALGTGDVTVLFFHSFGAIP